ncbi:MAG: 16S rRNA (cytosine(1402)-N(4))-methyltransferase RsmH [Chloroflexi bacterium]|nr:16S rRNA (cytosine(1402)-N(4))-methyltransferase RsmH [Chloroflexota bacterium]MCL5075656.1 16S rRNA (cytosine(1402)-N(4))-methyltransferase RsmH [Chloroflexota bacterium]
MAFVHIPVLYDEVLQALEPRAGGRYIDCTVGSGGHAAGILELSSPDGTLLGLDIDPMAIVLARERLDSFGSRVTLVREDFIRLKDVAEKYGFKPANGILFDLGVSSFQLGDPARGFSFQVDAPLDMRFDQNQGVTAAEIVNRLGEDELTDLLYRFGEEHRARVIVKAVVKSRQREPIRTTRQLANIIKTVLPGRQGRIHPATKTFQALRIAVNHELDNLRVALEEAVNLLSPEGRLVIISFHSLEDRIVKQFLANKAKGCVCPPSSPICVCGWKPSLELSTKKPVRPSPAEVARNRRSRSARMRVARALRHESVGW